MKVTCKHLSLAKADISAEESWFQVFPAYGRYPVGGSIPGASAEAVYVFNEATAKDIIDNFNAARAERPDWPGILVDREHFSCDPEKPSDAMAWATDIRLADDGSIWCKWSFTPKGKELWETKTLVNRSPCFDCSANGKDVKSSTEFYPFQLVSIGMTNTPHFQSLSALAAAKSAAEATNKENQNMDKILEALGLQPGASEDEVLGAITTLKDKASAAEVKASECEERAKKCEGECRALKADQFLKDHAEQIADPAKCREVFMKDPELAEQMLASCKKAEAPKPTNQQILASAKAPTKSEGVMAELAKCKSAEERIAFVTAHAAEFAAEAK